MAQQNGHVDSILILPIISELENSTALLRDKYIDIELHLRSLESEIICAHIRFLNLVRNQLLTAEAKSLLLQRVSLMDQMQAQLRVSVVQLSVQHRHRLSALHTRIYHTWI